jgi:tetratricopeptide (TPR) repeat protein
MRAKIKGWRGTARAGMTLGVVCAAAAAAVVVATASSEEPPALRGSEARVVERLLPVASTNAAAALALLRAQWPASAGAAMEYWRGNLCLQAGQPAAAVEAYRAAVLKAGAFRDAELNLGRALLALERYREAATTLAALARRPPRDAAVLLLLGRALLLGDDAAAAAQAFREAMTADPEETAARVGLARALLENDDVAACPALLAAVADRRPLDKELWRLRASVHLALHQDRRAAVCLESARRLALADGAMLKLLGDLYLNAGQPQDAMACYRDSLAQGEPEATQVVAVAQACLGAGYVEEGAAVLKRHAALRAGAAAGVQRDWRRTAAALAWRRGQAAEALAHCEAALELDPLDGDTLLLSGAIQRQEGNVEAARTAFERASRVKGSEAEGLLRLALLAVDGNDEADACRRLEASLVYRDDPRARRYLELLRRRLAVGGAAEAGSGER